jgi:uroporphyrinogen decarboxylase
MITHRDRLEACLSGEPLERVPVALWRHFPVDDQNPERLAHATLAFQRQFDFDLVKVTPASSFCIKDWGVQDEWRGATEGTRDYTHTVIERPEDWAKLPVLDPRQGHLGAQLDCLRILVKELEPHTPVIQTIFNPLSQAKNLVGKGDLLVHLRCYPEALEEGLGRIAESTRRYIEAVAETGVAGIFYAVQHAQYRLLSEAEYRRFGRAYDVQVLESAESLWLKMLHIHGTHVMFDLLADYPVNIVNWHDQETAPSLREGKEVIPGAVCGGLRREESMVLGTPDQIKAEAQTAIQATGGQRFILGTGCVVPITAPYGNLMAARSAGSA